MHDSRSVPLDRETRPPPEESKKVRGVGLRALGPQRAGASKEPEWEVARG